MATLAADWQSRFHPRLPEALQGFMKDMHSTNKTFQQHGEPFCQHTAAGQGLQLSMGAGWTPKPRPPKFSSQIKAGQDRGAGGSLGVTDLIKGQGIFRDTAGDSPELMALSKACGMHLGEISSLGKFYGDLCLHENRHLSAELGRFDGDWRRELACPSCSGSCWDDCTRMVYSRCAEMPGRVL